MKEAQRGGGIVERGVWKGWVRGEGEGEGEGWSMVDDAPRSSIKSIPRSEKKDKERGRSVTPIRCP